LYSIISGVIGGHILFALLPIIAILNFIVICGEDLICLVRPYGRRASRQTIAFKRAVRKAQKNQTDNSYRHKCSVCGITDVDDPDKQFRYCSRCNGYHCFCIDHINNHVHFSE
jgi:hypothetical protein